MSASIGEISTLLHSLSTLAFSQSDLIILLTWASPYGTHMELSKGAKIRNLYNQVPHQTQDTNGKVTNPQLDKTNESQEVSPFPAGDHNAHINRRSMLQFSEDFTKKHSIKSDVNAMWTEFSDICAQLMTDHNPSKLTSKRFNQPWTNRNVKRLSRRKKKAYNKARATKNKSDWIYYKELKKECQRESRKAYSSHVNTLVSEDQTGNPKK